MWKRFVKFLNNWWFNIILILIVASLIFFSSLPERYESIKDFSTGEYEVVANKSYKITQEYSPKELDRVERMLGNAIGNIRYNKVCFRDEGSHITEPAFINSDLKFNITYNNQSKMVSHVQGDRTLFSEEQCFKIKDKSMITWNWEFDSSFEMTKSFLKVGEFAELIVSPRLHTYLHVSNLYYFFRVLLSIFYSGVFWWAITRIIKFVRDGFKKI